MTQLPGKSSLGHVAKCSFGIFYVCNFFPGGNYAGKYKENVPAVIGSGNDATCKYNAPLKG